MICGGREMQYCLLNGHGIRFIPSVSRACGRASNGVTSVPRRRARTLEQPRRRVAYRIEEQISCTTARSYRPGGAAGLQSRPGHSGEAGAVEPVSVSARHMRIRDVTQRIEITARCASARAWCVGHQIRSEATLRTPGRRVTRRRENTRYAPRAAGRTASTMNQPRGRH